MKQRDNFMNRLRTACAVRLAVTALHAAALHAAALYAPALPAVLLLFGVTDAWATTDTTFAAPLTTVTDMVGGTGGQLAAVLAVGAALVGSVLRFQRDPDHGRGGRRRGCRCGRRGRDQYRRHGDHLVEIRERRRTVCDPFPPGRSGAVAVLDDGRGGGADGSGDVGVGGQRVRRGPCDRGGRLARAEANQARWARRDRDARGVLVSAGRGAASSGRACEPPAPLRRVIRAPRAAEPLRGQNGCAPQNGCAGQNWTVVQPRPRLAQ